MAYQPSEISPVEVMDNSEDISIIYENCVGELLRNIAKHWTDGTTEKTLEWQVRMMGELGAVTDESIEIIAKYSGQSTTVIREELMKSVNGASKIAFGALTEEKAEEIRNALRGYGGSKLSPTVEAEFNQLSTMYQEKANLINANMLNSAVQNYINKTNVIATEAQKTVTDVEGNVMAAATGQDTLREAVNNAVERLANDDIVAFTAKNGAQWTADAYMTMVARTSMETMAVKTLQGVGADAGLDVFQVSSHLGARPQCAPWQGKFYSWSNRSGVIRDAYGKEHYFEPVSVTTYQKEPAGLFGINCGHWPIPVAEGAFVDTEDKYTYTENKTAYQNSQTQNALERNVRNAKQALSRASLASNADYTSSCKADVKRAQNALKTFEKANDMKSRPYRTQI